MEIIKIDFSQQKNSHTGFYEKIEYEEKHIVRIINEYLDGTWQNYWSRMRYAAIEQQMYGTFSGKKIEGDKKYPLMSRILYTSLEARGICCFMVNQRSIRKDFGTQLKKEEQTGSPSKDRKIRKEKSIEKFREIVGDQVYRNTKKKVGKVDDVADAFLIALWAKKNLNQLIAAKEKNNATFKWKKHVRTKQPKRFIKVTLILGLPQNIRNNAETVEDEVSLNKRKRIADFVEAENEEDENPSKKRRREEE